ncbi:MAG: DUF6168 family protein [Bacteroidota bacterium]
MLKRILLSIAIATVVSMLLFYLHREILSVGAWKLSFSLANSYIFHFIFFLIAVLVIEVVFMLSPAQLGFSYLGVVFVKLGAYIVVFKGVLFDQDVLPMEVRLSLIIPLLLYILPEAMYCARMLKKVDVLN